MDISEVAKLTGVPASTLRFYEKKGLIVSLGRQGERRRFANSVLGDLALISLGQAAGLSLEEIRSMMLPGGEPNIDRSLLAEKADEIDALIERLTGMSYGLRHAAACPAPSHAECPTFKKLLKAAASGTLERRWAGDYLKQPRKSAGSHEKGTDSHDRVVPDGQIAGTK